MSKRYQKRRTLTGLPTGKRVRWLTFRPTNKMVYDDGSKPNHIFMIVKVDTDGKYLKYAGWTGQVGICRIKGEIHHHIPGNLFAHEKQSCILIYSVFVPFGQEDQCCSNFVDSMNRDLDKPVLHWWMPAGMTRGKVSMEPLTKEVSKLAGVAFGDAE